MSDHNAEFDHRDPATTALLERLVIPDHGAEFWDELTARLADQPAEPPVDRLLRFDDRFQRRLLVAAAVSLTVLIGAALVTTWDVGDSTQPINTDPSPDVSGTPDSDEDATVSTASGDDGQWFFADQIVWSGDKFVAAAQFEPAHWTSPDGIDWKRQDGSSPLTAISFTCPDGFDCQVDPDIVPIPFHFAAPDYQIVARADNVILLSASVRYEIDRQHLVSPADGEEWDPGPELHPDLLAAAAETDPCFREVLERGGQPDGLGEDRDAAYISSWSGSGPDTATISVSCQQAGHSAGFQLPLREHLTEAQIDARYSIGREAELWVQAAGSPARRVADPPTMSYWADGVVGGDRAERWVISSSGDRFWALDEGTLVSGTDGMSWVEQTTPATGLEPTDLVASPEGHLALRLADADVVGGETGWITVSHDRGVTWSEPVESAYSIGPWGPYLAVGPAGVVVTPESDGERRLVLIDGGEVVFDRELPADLCCEAVVVGQDRVLVQGNESMDLYGLDGTLLHRITWSPDRSWWERIPLPLTVALVLAYIVVAVLLHRRRRFADRLPG
ncbi:MAG: hypothetical protein OER95_07015 [Acidimicrobiia bacterium]|nr:hypothetical protein [Acidimicrobiia bacterium]